MYVHRASYTWPTRQHDWLQLASGYVGGVSCFFYHHLGHEATAVVVVLDPASLARREVVAQEVLYGVDAGAAELGVVRSEAPVALETMEISRGTAHSIVGSGGAWFEGRMHKIDIDTGASMVLAQLFM